MFHLRPSFEKLNVSINELSGLEHQINLTPSDALYQIIFLIITIAKMKPPMDGKERFDVAPPCLQNGTMRTHLGSDIANNNNDVSQGSDTWDQQRTRIDGLLSTLKKEMQEVKTMDKNLTRQFIHLGGKIQELKKAEEKLFEEILGEEDAEDVVNENSNYNNNENTSVTVLEDTRL